VNSNGQVPLYLVPEEDLIKYKIILKKIEQKCDERTSKKSIAKNKQNINLKLKRCQKVSANLLKIISSSFTLNDHLADGLPLGKFFTSLLLTKLDTTFNHYNTTKDIISKANERNPNSGKDSVISNIYLYEKLSRLFHSFFSNDKTKKFDYFKAIKFLSTIYSKFSVIEELSSVLVLLVLEQSFKLVSFGQLVKNISIISEIENKILGISIIESLNEKNLLNCSRVLLEKISFDNNDQEFSILKMISNKSMLSEFETILNESLSKSSKPNEIINKCLFFGFLYSLIVKRLTLIYGQEMDSHKINKESSVNCLKYSLSLALLYCIQTFLSIFKFANDKFPSFKTTFSWMQTFSSSYYNFLIFINRFLIFFHLLDIDRISKEVFLRKIQFDCWNSSNILSIFLDVFNNGKAFELWIFKNIGEIYLSTKNSKDDLDFQESQFSQNTNGKTNGLKPNIHFQNINKERVSSIRSKAVPQIYQNHNKESIQKQMKMFKPNSQRNYIEPTQLDQKFQKNNFHFTSLEKRDSFHNFRSQNEKRKILKKINFVAKNSSNNFYNNTPYDKKTFSNSINNNQEVSSLLNC
jgi:hypothetical protein